MLHEVLLALSGHPSPLFENGKSDFPLTTPAERALLSSVGHLAFLHRAMRTQLPNIAATHSSTICRAVASSVLSSHLSQFQQLILDVEQQILSNDPSCVGAYNIVPLAGVVKRFNVWTRKLEWYWDLTNLMLTNPSSKPESKIAPTPCNGATVIQYLRSSSQTGYTDIAAAAVELEKVAERVWLRLLSSWVLHGQLPSIGLDDFFVKQTDAVQLGKPDYQIDTKLLTPFVDEDTSLSILFIGKTLKFFENFSQQKHVTRPTRSSDDAVIAGGRAVFAMQAMQKDCIRILDSIYMPIKASNLTTAIKNIRKSLSSKIADEILPVHELIYTFRMLRIFFLGTNIEFSDTLIEESDKHIAARHLQLRVESKYKPANGLAGVVMKQGELTAILSRTWAVLAPLVRKDEVMVDDLEWGRDHLRLSLSKHNENEMTSGKEVPGDLLRLAQGTFNDLLLSTPATLNLELGSTFDLFLSPADLQVYSIIYTYLLAIRRGQLHMTKLWREDFLRKDARFVHNSKTGDFKGDVDAFSKHREKITTRSQAMRKIWASSTAAIFILSELGGYFVESVIEPSWQRFNSWACNTGRTGVHTDMKDINAKPKDEFTVNELSASPTVPINQSQSPSLANNDAAEENFPKDPEALATAHRRYLAMLTESLLLTDNTFARHLRNLVTNVDVLVGFAERLKTVQLSIDQHEGNEIDYLLKKFTREEEFTHNEMTKASDKVDAAVQSLVGRLHKISSTRSSVSRLQEQDGFDAWDGTGSIERLISRLDNGVQVEL